MSYGFKLDVNRQISVLIKIDEVWSFPDEVEEGEKEENRHSHANTHQSRVFLKYEAGRYRKFKLVELSDNFH